MSSNKIPKLMVDFIKEHHVMTLATTYKDMPSTCSLFYTFIEDEGCFIFASSMETEHMRNIMQNPDVSANIHVETREVERIRGIQIKGMVEKPHSRGEHLYLKEHPYAADVNDKELWKLKITELKYTDNTVGFGQKELWTY